MIGIGDLIDFIGAQPERPAYFFLFMGLLISGIWSPIPEDFVLLAAGYLIYKGTISFYIIPLMFIGAIISDCFPYTAGRIWGVRILRWRVIRQSLTRSRLHKARIFLHKYGKRAVFFGR